MMVDSDRWVIGKIEPWSVSIQGVGLFKPRPDGTFAFTPDPNLSPDDAARNLIEAVQRLCDHNP